MKSNFFREIALLAAFLSSKIDFWPFLKLQIMEFGQKIRAERIFLGEAQKYSHFSNHNHLNFPFVNL